MYSYSLTTQANVFAIGNYTTQLQTIDSASSFSPPKSLLIANPVEGGQFAVLLFLHGFLLENLFYSLFMQHIASHGFIVIAPQLYTLLKADANDEIKSTAAITNWLSEGLSKLLPQNVRPDLTKLALSGHSRGGKTAFALALKKLNTSTILNFSAIIGVDPVDGLGKALQISPPVLTFSPHSFHLNMPVMIIGSGLGELQRNPLFLACAPKSVSHEEFYSECNKPAWHFVAKDYGHFDILDDVTKGIVGKSTCCLCKNGKSRKPMRLFVGGVTVAFLKAYLRGDNSDLLAITDKRLVAPVDLQIQYSV